MSQRKKFVAGNWKMHKTQAEGRALVEALREAMGPGGPRVCLFPPYTAIAAVAEATAGSAIEVGGQNLHWEAQGAFTGEVSAQMLVEAGASCVLVGHSERRQLFGETDETANQKVHAALAAGLTPILCVGETLEQRDAGSTLEVVGGQVRKGLAGLSKEQLGKTVIAYEPVWAIGTGRTATPAQAQEVHASIRAVLREIGGDVADAMPIQYGGSVNAKNAAELLALPDVDGALVGGASLDAASFAEIIRAGA